MNILTMKKLVCVLGIMFFGVVGYAQKTNITGEVIDASTYNAIKGVRVGIENTLIEVFTNNQGKFHFLNQELPLGEQVLTLEKEGFVTKRYPIVINQGKTLTLEVLEINVDINQESIEIGTISLSDNELSSEESTADNLSGLLQASNDVFLNAASYDFSATFFKPRGFDSANGKVLINGIEMNKMFNGRPQWSNWGGLNDAQRNRVFTMGTQANDYNFGDLAGTTNIIMRASQYRKGGRVSYAASNRSYTGRVMGSYNSGMLKGGWAFSVLASRRFGEEGFRDASAYDANSFFLSVEKQLNEKHSLNFSALYTPNRRGKTSANTQEVYDLKDTKYNEYWGYQDGEKRNSRMKEIEEPIFMLNHYWNISENTELNTNVAYQFGKMGNSRLGYDNVANPSPAYYRKLPSFELAQDPVNYEEAYRKTVGFQQDGQIDWNRMYGVNQALKAQGETSHYYLYEDRVDDNQLTANTILTTRVNDYLTVNGSLHYRKLNSENFANMIDLLGGTGYLDIDSFNTGDASQNDLNNPNRIVGVDDTFKYHYEIDAEEYRGFAQAQFHFNKLDFYIGGKIGKTTYQRNGLYRSGSFPNNSYGKGEKLDFTTYGTKLGLTYRLTGRHQFNMNAAYIADAPGIRSSFSNSRQNNAVVKNATTVKKTAIDASYIFRTPTISARLTGYYTNFQDETDISFFYADGISLATEASNSAFIQEILTGIDKQHIGAEFGIEAQVTPTIKLKGAASYGEYTYNNNPNLYITSDDFSQELDYGKAYLENYRVAGGPQQAYQAGFEYRDPNFWFVGATVNYFADAYVDISPLMRTKNFNTVSLNGTDVLNPEYDEAVAKELLRQENFGDYTLVNLIGGKSWRVNDYYIGFFATINNIFDTKYKTGGYEQGRNSDYTSLLEDNQNEKRVFGPKYWYGYGTTYYLNLYVRF